ncbi:MAG: hypothetical protein HRT71_04645 [Flavobacteriales bacterium]|nr:hypothetical protein [Flavobacteriales bacterium]
MANNDSDDDHVDCPELHYIINDEECPLPVAVPHVSVGFWVNDTAEVAADLIPACTGQPLFTIVYPLNENGKRCYGWKHFTGNPGNPIYPNSAEKIEWKGGSFSFTQWTTMDCTFEEHGPAPEDGAFKESFWTPFHETPDELWAKIIGVVDVPVDQLRQDSVILLRSADGQFVGLDGTDERKVVCDSRYPKPKCELIVKFPNFKWNRHGGSEDEGDFALMAPNGKYLKRQLNEDGSMYLSATAVELPRDSLFTLDKHSDYKNNRLVSLKEAGTDRVLYHPSPSTDLILKAPKDLIDEDNEEINAHGFRFTVSFKSYV